MTDIKEAVRQKYSQAAARVGSCCGGAGARRRKPDHVQPLLQRWRPASSPKRPCWPRSAAAIPTALAELKPGETVLDLGSGGGIDVLLSARRVGPTGKAYGLDMTDEMLALARENQRKAGVENVEFLKGEIEQHPAAGQFGRRDHLQLRHQSVGRQGPGAARGVPRAEAGRPVRRLRRRDARRGAGRGPAQHGAVGRLHRRRAGGERVSRQARRRPASRSIEHRADPRLPDRGRPRVPRRPGHRRRRDRRQVDGKFMSAFVRAPQARAACCDAECCAVQPDGRRPPPIVSEASARPAAGRGGRLRHHGRAAGRAATSPSRCWRTRSPTGRGAGGADPDVRADLGRAFQSRPSRSRTHRGAACAWPRCPPTSRRRSSAPLSASRRRTHVRAAALLRLDARAGRAGAAVQRVRRHLRTAAGHLGLCARAPGAVPFAVGPYITAAYWFTASTSFANPAVTLARALSDTFAGIRPADAPGLHRRAAGRNGRGGNGRALALGPESRPHQIIASRRADMSIAFGSPALGKMAEASRTAIGTSVMTIKPELNGHTALVTGASRGIGAAIATALAEAGAARRGQLSGTCR